MREGRIVERGKHGELLERKGLYWQMWELQNQILDLDGVEGANINRVGNVNVGNEDK